jgi:hypothetical protein
MGWAYRWLQMSMFEYLISFAPFAIDNNYASKNKALGNLPARLNKQSHDTNRQQCCAPIY